MALGMKKARRQLRAENGVSELPEGLHIRLQLLSQPSLVNLALV